jgi:nucleoside-diphosphate-sugar epimerase
MRVLVTGAAGRIGRHVVAELLEHDHEVHGLDRASLPLDLSRRSVLLRVVIVFF